MSDGLCRRRFLALVPLSESLDISTSLIASWTSSRVTVSANFSLATAEAKRKMERRDRAMEKFNLSFHSFNKPEVNSRLSLRSSTYALTMNSVSDAGTVGF